MLRKNLKHALFTAPRVVGLYRYLRRKHRDKAVVLTYHGVLPEIKESDQIYEYRNFVTSAQFEQQIQLMLQHYRPLKVSDFYEPGDSLAGGFLITFDDGFRNNLRYAAPVLQKYGLEGCFFITTGLIGTRELLWTEQVTRLLHNTRMPQLELPGLGNFPLTGRLDQEKASEVIRRHMKLLPAGEVGNILDIMKQQLSDVRLSVLPEDEERYLFMSWDEIKQLLDMGQAIGAHTHTHPMLAPLSEEESLFELQHSRELLETHTGRACLSMSYPNGQRDNYSPTQIRQLQELGYACAFTQVPHYNTAATNRYELRRINVSLQMNLPLFEATVCGFR